MPVAVIIPTLNEEEALPRCLDSVRGELREGDFVVVVDGGSSDATAKAAAGCEWLESAPGRGVQLDAGARFALDRGTTALLFVHADSTMPSGWRQCLDRADITVGGGCLVEFADAPWLLRQGARLVNWRTRRLRRPLGDQAQFATAEAYRASGGFPHWPILEDTEFLRRLARLGRLTILPLTVTTDSRRFRERGIVRTVVTNWLIWTLFACGVKPPTLARLYRNIR